MLIANSPISNTYNSIQVALLTSVGKRIEKQYRNAGCFRPVKVLTKPGTIVHPLLPATQGNSTNFVAKQIIEVTWHALSKTIPQETPAGWSSLHPGSSAALTLGVTRVMALRIFSVALTVPAPFGVQIAGQPRCAPSRPVLVTRDCCCPR